MELKRVKTMETFNSWNVGLQITHIFKTGPKFLFLSFIYLHSEASCCFSRIESSSFTLGSRVGWPRRMLTRLPVMGDKWVQGVWAAGLSWLHWRGSLLKWMQKRTMKLGRELGLPSHRDKGWSSPALLKNKSKSQPTARELRNGKRKDIRSL